MDSDYDLAMEWYIRFGERTGTWAQHDNMGYLLSHGLIKNITGMGNKKPWHYTLTPEGLKLIKGT